MRVQNIHPHRMTDGTLAFTFQMVDSKGDIVPYFHEMTTAECAWLMRQLALMIYEDVSR